MTDIKSDRASISTAEHWKVTVLAGLANYIDAGSIVAASAALALWVELYHLTNSSIGILAALGANGVSAGIGALIGGRLCDRYGRKKIYQYDMLFYAFGMLWLVFAVAPWMIVIGVILVGLAVGADIPASWSLIAETAPEGERGKHSGMAQVLWHIGPAVVLLLALVLSPFGMLGIRIVFAHLLVIALLLTLLRARMSESKVWEAARAAEAVSETRARTNWVSALFTRSNLKAMAFLIGVYGFWNLWAGTHGFFFPYILRTVGNQSQGMSVGLQAGSFIIGVISVIVIFMRYADRMNHRLLFGIAVFMQVAGMAMLALLPLTLPVAIGYLAIMSIANGFGAQPFFQLWSCEMFPTLMRSTGQGLTFAVVRIALGIWSFFVPLITAVGFSTLAWILTGFLAVSGIIGVIWGPRNEGKSLETLEAELGARQGGAMAHPGAVSAAIE